MTTVTDDRIIIIHTGPYSKTWGFPALAWAKEVGFLTSVWYGQMGGTCYNWLADNPTWFHAERCMGKKPTLESVARHFLAEVVPAAAVLDLPDKCRERLKMWERASYLTIAEATGAPADIEAARVAGSDPWAIKMLERIIAKESAA